MQSRLTFSHKMKMGLPIKWANQKFYMKSGPYLSVQISSIIDIL